MVLQLHLGDCMPTLFEKGWMSMLSEELKASIKEELDDLFHDRQDLLEMFARECHLHVPYSPDFTVYRSNVLSEAEKDYQVAKLIKKVLNAYPHRSRLWNLLPALENAEEETR